MLVLYGFLRVRYVSPRERQRVVRASQGSITFDRRTSAVGAGQTHTSAVKGRCRFLHWLSRKEGSYASFKACAMSAIRSDGGSMPIDSRIVQARTPIFWRMSARTPEWVMLAGRLASDSVPPRLTASLKICSAVEK